MFALDGDSAMEPTAILLANLRDAFNQLNTYFALGLAAAVSAFRYVPYVDPP
jgi:hypothetical protein